MNRYEIYSSIIDFLSLFEESEGTVEQRIQSLKILLDRLALASNFVEYKFDETDYPDAPQENYEELRKLISTIFPDFGNYNSVSEVTSQINNTKVVVGDAIDDIVDINLDMKRVLWHWQNTSIDNALWHFENSYHSHWGQHLRDLQLYLYSYEMGV